MRSSWVSAVIQVQKLSMKCMPLEPIPDPPQDKQPVLNTADNSLLVVRYEEKVPNPEESAKKRPPPQSPDSDEERLIIDEPAHRKSFNTFHKCPHCPYQSKYSQVTLHHIYRHYDMYPFGCPYCDYSGHRHVVMSHLTRVHPNEPKYVKTLPLPTGPVTTQLLRNRLNSNKRVCLTCQCILTQGETISHKHEGNLVYFAKNGDIVCKCSICPTYRKDVSTMQMHYAASHINSIVNYKQYQIKLPAAGVESKVVFVEIKERAGQVLVDLDDSTSHSEDSNQPPPPKRVAKKSTTKLPMQAVAKKSTTKLPRFMENEEYTFYGTKPTPMERFANVTTLMPFCNTMMPFTVKKLSEILSINPQVIVKDIKK